MSGLPTAAQQRAWLAQWRAAAVALEQQRWLEFRQADLGMVAAQLEDALLQSLRTDPPGLSSGLIQQQQLFHRHRRS